jgi:hypothetical protein
MEIKPVHTELPLLARTTAILPDEMHRIVTLLNRQLKARGLVFGLRLKEDGHYEFSIYDTKTASVNVPVTPAD